MANRIAPKLLAEFIGTFAFVFIGAGAAVVVREGVGKPGIVAIAFAHGLAIMAFAFAYGSVSGGHFNPAVTVGALFLSSVLGGAETGLGTPALAHNLALGATTLTITPAAGFMIEAVLGFFLVTVVLSTAVAGRDGSVAPLAIGMTLTFNILMGGALTGAAFNPARALGPMVATGNFSDAWLYLTAPVVGAIVAAILHTGLVRLLSREGTAASQRGRVAQTPAE
jgi:glycerol uptake facilitator-like aquaporin